MHYVEWLDQDGSVLQDSLVFSCRQDAERRARQLSDDIYQAWVGEERL